MKLALPVAILLIGAGNCLAKDPPVFQKGVLLNMESAPCGYAEKGGKTVAGEILGTDSENKKTNEVLCQEYVLQSEHVTYRIRPRDDKHPALLPLGETAEFRIEKDRMKLRVPEADQKEREYTVVSMTMRDDPSSRSSAKNDKR
jgi:hypothetical protein